jgi:selenide,water dikinase
MSAHRGGEAKESDYLKAAFYMERLNKYAAEKLSGCDVSAVTDVTGFGLLGHLGEMAGAELTMVINFDSLPIIGDALAYAEGFLSTAAGQRNRNHLEASVDTVSISSAQEEILYDPQTSGGLLIAVSARDAKKLLDKISESDTQASIIGQAVKTEGPKVIVF